MKLLKLKYGLLGILGLIIIPYTETSAQSSGRFKEDSVQNGLSNSDEQVLSIIKEAYTIKTDHQWKVNLIYPFFIKPNLSYEHRIGNNFSSESSIEIGYYDYRYNSFLSPDVTYTQRIKYYYNFKKRESTGKKIQGFSANFISLFIKGSINSKAYAGIGADFGLQRRIGKNMFIQFSAGAIFPFVGDFEKQLWIDDEFVPIRLLSDLEDIYPFAQLSLGFAFESFKKSKPNPYY